MRQNEILVNKRNIFTIIQQNNVGFREFLGYGRTKLSPGFNIDLPFFHFTRTIPLCEIKLDINEICCYTRDNVPVTIDGTLYVKVIEQEKTCYNVDNYINGSIAIGTSTVRSLIGQFEYDCITSDRNTINKRLRENIGNDMNDWGVECTRFELQQFNPSSLQVQHHLEKQMEAERSRRENELNTQAKIRTAEGEKISQIHMTEAEYKTMEFETNGKVYEMQQITKATEEQLLKISSVLGSENSASEYLL
jgi:regulator of protease activity HflC (stomatin/prohibitin superfamily)